ncbi:hypothetical protein GCM10022402_42880 [Salinactinospora qingdaonensis]|uniref:Uncharacterized protein n=2 Tax=Salinactinospora qingdaonensis TaxID=702744 RepID=A0ABP7GGJ8_9ACTN
MDALTAAATVGLHTVQGARPTPEGIEGDYQPSVTMVDCFVVNLQLAQVLMYEMDGIRRSDSNTLWMLNTVLEAQHPHRSTAPPLRAHTNVTNKHLLTLRGDTWRNVDLAGTLAGVELRCSFAHQLPASAVPITG